MTIRVYTGPMKSGKSSKLIADIKLAKQNNIDILVVSSNVGFRKNKTITSRDGSKASAVGVDNFTDIVNLLTSEEYKNVTKVFVDEAQFIPNNAEDILNLINHCLKNKINITMSGLELNCFGKPFETMGTLFCLADKVTKFRGYCDCCKVEESTRVIRYKDGEVDRDELNVVAVDSKHTELKYMAVCSDCFLKLFYLDK